MDDVKREFYAFLDSLIISPGLATTTISVRVIEAAFEKMLADPEYMQKMKDLCARDLCDPEWNKIAAQGRAPSASIITIDADVEEEYLASTFSSEADRPKASGDNDFWTRRNDKYKEGLAIQAERAAERRTLLDVLQERADARKQLLTDAATTVSIGSGATCVFLG